MNQILTWEDCMVDIETFGTKPDAPIISIGAVFFDIPTNRLGPTFYMALDVADQMKRGRMPDADTLKWWMGQADAAKKVFHEKAKSPAEVLGLFIMWYATGGKIGQVQLNPPDILAKKARANVWGNGSTFDITMLEDILRTYEKECPWAYNRVMDLRTFKRFVGRKAPVAKTGTDHNALDDAVSQAQYVLDAMNPKENKFVPKEELSG